MNEGKTSLGAKILGILYIGVVLITYLGAYILPVFIYFYTIYYYFADSNFFGAFISFLTPVISSIYLFITLLCEQGLSNMLTIPILACVVCYIILFLFIKKEK